MIVFLNWDTTFVFMTTHIIRNAAADSISCRRTLHDCLEKVVLHSNTNNPFR